MMDALTAKLKRSLREGPETSPLPGGEAIFDTEIGYDSPFDAAVSAVSPLDDDQTRYIKKYLQMQLPASMRDAPTRPVDEKVIISSLSEDLARTVSTIAVKEPANESAQVMTSPQKASENRFLPTHTAESASELSKKQDSSIRPPLPPSNVVKTPSLPVFRAAVTSPSPAAKETMREAIRAEYRSKQRGKIDNALKSLVAVLSTVNVGEEQKQDSK